VLEMDNPAGCMRIRCRRKVGAATEEGGVPDRNRTSATADALIRAEKLGMR
jgi:hypothetical protein